MLAFTVGRASATALTVTQVDDSRPVDVLCGTLNALGYLGLSELEQPAAVATVVVMR